MPTPRIRGILWIVEGVAAAALFVTISMIVWEFWLKDFLADEIVWLLRASLGVVL